MSELIKLRVMPCDRRHESERKSPRHRDVEKRSRALRRDVLIGGYRVGSLARARTVSSPEIPLSFARVCATACFLLCRNASLFPVRRPSPPPLAASISLRRQIHPRRCTLTRTSGAKQSAPTRTQVSSLLHS